MMAESEKARDLELNDAMNAVGFGMFQIGIFALLFPVATFHGARMTSTTFFLMQMEHRCALPDVDNDTYDIRSKEQQYYYNRTIPPSDSCHIYDAAHHHFTYDKYNRPINASHFVVSCPNGTVYAKDVVKQNAVSQLGFICEDSILKTHAKMFLYLGSLLGATALGVISDWYGRKTCFLISVSIFLPCGIALPWAPDFATLSVLQFLLGAASTGMFASAFVMVLEIVQPHLRKFPGLIIMLFFVTGEFLLVASFYGLRDWLWVSIIITAPTVFFLSYYWLLPESLRWLMMKKKYEQASKIINTMARRNGRAIPGAGRGADEDVEKLLESYENPGKFTTVIHKKDSFLDLFKSCVLATRILTICFNWTIVNMMFYGFTLNSEHLPTGSPYTSFAIGAAAEIPANLFTLLLVDRMGRRAIHCVMLLLTVVTSAGAVCVVYLADEEHMWIVAVLATLGKMGAGGLMSTSFLWMTELFPTSVRSTGLGVGSSFARAGAMASPYIVDFGEKLQPHTMGRSLPFIVFGIGAFIDFVLCLFLPETNARDLPETVEQAKYFGRERPREETRPVNGGATNYGTVVIN